MCVSQTCVSVYKSINLRVSLCVSVGVNQTCISVCKSINLRVSLCMSVGELSADVEVPPCLSVYLSMCVTVCAYHCFSVFMHVSLCVCVLIDGNCCMHNRQRAVLFQVDKHQCSSQEEGTGMGQKQP